MRFVRPAAELLESTEPLQLEAYLRSTGWRLAETLDGRGQVWLKSAERGEFELLLALDRELADYTTRLAEVLGTLEAAENRSVLDIAMDIRRSSADAVRFSAEGPGITPGSMQVEAASAMIAGCRDVILAAACAAIDKRAVFPNRKPPMATEYMSRVQLETPRPGSFQLTLLSPVPPALGPEMFAGAEGEPFERRVVRTLWSALEHARKASQTASATGDPAAFFEGVPFGVHANLLEAAASLLEVPSVARVALSVNWSPTRPVSERGPFRMHLPTAAAPFLREASRLFREKEPNPEFELEGMVIEAKAQEPMFQGGKATVAAYVGNAIRHVGVYLEPEAYSLALGAHEKWLPVRCVGELVRTGRAYELKNPRMFKVVEA